MVGRDKAARISHRIAGFEPFCVGSRIGDDVEEVALVETELVRRCRPVVANRTDNKLGRLNGDGAFDVGKGTWARMGCGRLSTGVTIPIERPAKVLETLHGKLAVMKGNSTGAAKGRSSDVDASLSSWEYVDRRALPSELSRSMPRKCTGSEVNVEFWLLKDFRPAVDPVAYDDASERSAFRPPGRAEERDCCEMAVGDERETGCIHSCRIADVDETKCV